MQIMNRSFFDNGCQIDEVVGLGNPVLDLSRGLFLIGTLLLLKELFLTEVVSESSQLLYAIVTRRFKVTFAFLNQQSKKASSSINDGALSLVNWDYVYPKKWPLFVSSDPTRLDLEFTSVSYTLISGHFNSSSSMISISYMSESVPKLLSYSFSPLELLLVS